MVFNDRRVLKGQTRAQLILARRITLHPKAEYICADLSSRPNFSLAVARRTIHSQQPRASPSKAPETPPCSSRLGGCEDLYQVRLGEFAHCGMVTREYRLERVLLFPFRTSCKVAHSASSTIEVSDNPVFRELRNVTCTTSRLISQLDVDCLVLAIRDALRGHTFVSRSCVITLSRLVTHHIIRFFCVEARVS